MGRERERGRPRRGMKEVRKKEGERRKIAEK